MADRENPDRIVHVSGDFPDPVQLHKTAAIRALVDLTADKFDHYVFSLNRRSPGLGKWATRVLRGLGTPRLAFEATPFAYGEALTYEAPGRGLYHKTVLDQLGKALADEVRQHSRPPALLVAHKLSIEGLVVARMARELYLPFALCIQGDTDTKIVKARPDLARDFRHIFQSAKVVFPFAPWSLQAIEARLGSRSGPTHFLPCATELDEPLEPVAAGAGLVSIFHLKNYRRKNLAGIAEAMRLLQSGGSAATLSVIGGGSDADRRACARITGDVPGISLAGAMDRDAVRLRLNRATAMVLPSLRESFGLVFVEALFAGTPVIYPRGTAIDGYFDDAPFAIAVDARDPRSIAQGMRQAVENEIELKQALREWQLSPAAERFQRASIGKTFAEGLRQAIRTA